MYIDERIDYIVIEGYRCCNEVFQALFAELQFPKNANIIYGVIYRQYNPPERFREYTDLTIEKLNAFRKKMFLIGDFNLNILRFQTCTHAENLFLSLQSFNLTPTIDKPQEYIITHIHLY